jgi:hypothetical protein
MKNKIFAFLLPFVIVFLVALPIVLPFFHKGYFPTHDGEWAVVRLGDMFREIRDFQFPPRYSENLNFGYGYPLFNFAYPLPYYIGLIMHLLKFSFIDSIKFVFAGSVFLSILFMFYAAKEFWGNKWSAYIATILFAYFPYRMVDLYARGSIGETVAIVFFPLIFYFSVKLYKHPQQYAYIGLLAISIAGLFLSHNIMALLFFPIFLLFIIFLVGKKLKIYVGPFLGAILFGLMTSAFFWIPALAEKNLILLSKIPIADRSINFVSFWQLFFSPFGYGIPEAATGGFTYQIGWPQIISYLVVGYLVSALWLRKKRFVVQEKISGAFLVLIILMILMMFSFTNFIWKATPLLKEINYPWTLLGPLGFLISFIAGYIGTQKNQLIKIIGIAIGISAVVLYLPFAHPQTFTSHPDGYYLTNDATTTSSSEYTPLWVKQLPTHRPAEKVQLAPGSGKILWLVYNSKNVSFQALMGKYGGPVRINTIYYPGWNILVDGKFVRSDYHNAYGVMDISLPPGFHIVKATFSETPLRLAADILSLIGGMLIGIVVMSSFFVKKHL